MFGRQTTNRDPRSGQPSVAERDLRQLSASIYDLEQKLRSLHPERLTGMDLASIRRDFLKTLVCYRQIIDEVADMLHRLAEVDYGRRNPPRDHRR